jgi:hypothetical protein
MYDPCDDREEYEFDEAKLRVEAQQIFDGEDVN